ncbi:MAG: sporulation peptidase YabG [Firmicutes bacterium]|nr:sporulation peptidase YabG [Bacillota bacterium]
MTAIKKGDIVGRKSYGKDVLFKVVDLFLDGDRPMARLKGLHLRLSANSPLEDLVRIDPADVASYLVDQMKKTREQMNRILSRRASEREAAISRAVMEKNSVESFDVTGSVLHIDGDHDYLDLCMATYRQLQIPAHGYNIDEEQQPVVVEDLLKKHMPDMLVLTGHDGFIKGRRDYRNIDNYYASKFFVDAVRAARRYEKSRDDLVIFAGACQSHYEALLESGANFASSPKRVLIHAYDPVFVIEKIAYTSIYDPVPLREVIAGTITGFDGIGGLETRGKHRLGIPKSTY